MIPERKKPRPLSLYCRQILKYVEEYESKFGNGSGEDLNAVAEWAFRQGKWEPPRRNPARDLARDLAKASRQDYIKDDQGEPVRRRHSYPVTRGEVQLTFWVKIEDATPENMKISLQGRRNGALMDVLQADRDLRYYNKHYNPGDSIQLSWNFDLDVEERLYPSEYPEEPPENSKES